MILDSHNIYAPSVIDLTTASFPHRFVRLDSVFRIAINWRAAAGCVAACFESSRTAADASATAVRPGRSAAPARLPARRAQPQPQNRHATKSVENQPHSASGVPAGRPEACAGAGSDCAGSRARRPCTHHSGTRRCSARPCSFAIFGSRIRCAAMRRVGVVKSREGGAMRSRETRSTRIRPPGGVVDHRMAGSASNPDSSAGPRRLAARAVSRDRQVPVSLGERLVDQRLSCCVSLRPRRCVV